MARLRPLHVTAGFGSGTKRALGTRVLASQLESLFEKLRKAAAH